MIRAYRAGARSVLREAPKQILIPKSTIRITVPSSYVGRVYDAVAKASGATEGEECDVEGNLLVSITCETFRMDALRVNLVDATRSDARFDYDK